MADRVTSGRATSPLRLFGYGVVLVAMAFSQSGGLMVADTKFDLLTAPGTFLRRALDLWDPIAAFGQVQNQAYGYAWPMGPFFLIGDLAQLPEWAIQRLWWALLLCLAFFGVLRLAQRLQIGTPVTQVVAAFAFVLTPRITTLLGGTSVEVWPMALAPWVLLPLVAGAERGSVRRAGATSALVVACCGGVNAVAVAAVLPLGALWILTRASGPRRWRLFGWWTLCTVLATAWWSGPLLLVGRYSAPFLDYIENATITTIPTDVARTLVGVSDWVAYFASFDYPAGRELVATPFMLFDAAVIAALGLAGLALRSMPHQRFLILGVLLGAAIIGFGYAGEGSGFFAEERQALLDGALAPLRNLHKFDVVVRIPLVLGLAHLLATVPELLKGTGQQFASRAARAAVALALVGVASPWLLDHIAPSHGVEEIPAYWPEVANHLDDAEGGVALVVPGAAFGIYEWGNVHDDVLQGFATSPWAVRNVIPLAQPGNVVMMDAVTRVIESGRPSDQLAPFLAANGISRLVVRNDLDRLNTAAPDPAYVRGMLAGSAGLSLERSFGPVQGEPAVATARGTRVISGGGLAKRMRAVDVWSVSGGSFATLSEGVPEIVGGPGAGISTGAAQQPGVLAADVTSSSRPLLTGQVLTDDLRRRETNFSTVRWNQSATTAKGAPYRLSGPEHTHRVVQDVDRWSTTAFWQGAVSVSASTSEAYADALPPLSIGDHPGAALDRYRRTAWRSARQLTPVGQWWQLDFGGDRVLPSLTVRIARDSAPVRALRISLDGQAVVVTAPKPGQSRTYDLDLPVGRVLRVTAAGKDLKLPGSFAISEVRVPGLIPRRALALPAPDPRIPVDRVSLSRDPDRFGCVLLETAFPCVSALSAPGEDGDRLVRSFSVSTAEDYDLGAAVSLRRGRPAAAALGRLLGVTVTSGDTVGSDLARLPVAMVDGDDATTWLARGDFPKFRIQLPSPRVLDGLRVTLNRAAPASRPTELVVRDLNSKRRAVVTLDDRGRGELPGWRTDSLQITVRATERAFLVVGDSFVEASAGISELELLGPGPLSAAAATGVVHVPCGRAPAVRIDGVVHRTELFAKVQSLVRGDSVPLRVCGDSTVPLDTDGTLVVARPTALLRADTVTLDRNGAGSGTAPRVRPLELDRSAGGTPVSMRLPDRIGPGLLTLSQNINPGWQATLEGKTLRSQRVDGWKQGWIVPPGDAATVRFEYSPQPLYRGLLAGGLVLLALVAAAALPLGSRSRRKERPALREGRPGVLDAGLALAGAGLLGGWWVLALVALVLPAAVLLRRADGIWGPLAGLAMVAAGVGLTWPPIVDRSWALEWTQAAGLLALACLVGALGAGRAAAARSNQQPANRERGL